LVMGLALTLVIYREVPAQTPLPLPIRLNVGSNQPYTAQDGRVYLADQEWSPETQAGYIGGHQVYGRFPSGGTPDKLLYENQRRDWQEYRFSDIPNGDYLVTLHFSEMAVLEEHGPSYTIFDVAIEDQTVLDDFNIFAQVGSNYILVRRFAVTVTDGDLNVVSTPVFGESSLAAVEVDARPPDAGPPDQPTGVTTTSSYYAALIDWADNSADDLDGYHVYRAESDGGPYTRLTGEPTHRSRYQDVVTATHTPYFYRISAVDVYGNESTQSPTQSAVALDETNATLPYYQLELSPESLLALHNDPWGYEEVLANFIYEGRPYAVEVRYRGNWGRYHNKKSWKIKFLDPSPFGQDEINLRADYMDPSLLRSKLATTIFEAAGIPTPQTEHVLLAINGEYWGVYTRAEQVDELFLERIGRGSSVSIYKAVETDFMDFSRQQPSEEAYHEAFEKKTNTDTGYDDIITFIDLINDTPDEIFAYELKRVFDVASYLDYYALIILTGNNDFSSHNAYLLHDLAVDRWELVPYDLDRAFHPSDNWHELPPDTPIDRGTPESPIWNWVTNTLLTRVLDVPQFRAYYCHRLAEFMDTIYSDDVMVPLIDATYASIEADGLRDWHKYGWESNDWFTAAPAELKTYVTERKRFLRDEIPEYCSRIGPIRAERPYVVINEIMADNQTTLEDPENSGQYPAWFEIANTGLETVDLSGLHLTDDLSNPTRFRIAEGITVPAQGFITFFADNSLGRQTVGGPLHTDLRLEKQGGQIGIFSGTQQIDVYAFGPQTADVSEGRHPDGADNRIAFNVPTPGGSNLLLPPVVTGATHSPPLPTSSKPVTVTVSVTDDGTLLTTTLFYSATASGFVEVPMTCLHGNLYTAQIPPQPAGTRVEYYVRAGDDDGQVTTAPPDTSDADIEHADEYIEYIVDYHPPTLFINEFMADNETVPESPRSPVYPDEPGGTPDWIELFNPGPDPIDVGGRYLTDDLNVPTKFRIADGTTVPAGGFLVFYADDEPERGPLHTNFKLSKNGESIGLFDFKAAGNEPIDTHTFGPQAADVSEGRCPDGRAGWMSLALPTSGAANGPCSALAPISSVVHTPLFPSATDQVTVTASINVALGGTEIQATLWYSTGGDFVAMPMMHTGRAANHVRAGSVPADFAPALPAHTYAATIPAQPNDTQVSYYVQVEKGGGGSDTDLWRQRSHTSCVVFGYRPPSLLINEFMANNATVLEDPDEPGEFPDWIEIHNVGAVPIDLGGLYLTDDLADPAKFQIPDGLVVPAGGFVLFYADDDPEQGPFHTNFRLGRNGDSIGLFDADATCNQPIDTVIFDTQMTDNSDRRYPNGGYDWVTFHTPTPGRGDVAGRYLPTVLKYKMYE